VQSQHVLFSSGSACAGQGKVSIGHRQRLADVALHVIDVRQPDRDTSRLRPDADGQQLCIVDLPCKVLAGG